MKDANLKHKPELENDFKRDTSHSYQPHDGADNSIISYIEHGAPHPLIRWHYHEEYELHLITSTSGKAFIGDYIGDFEPGNLILIGPYLPHNWISNNLPEGGVSSRDISLQFANKDFRKSCRLLPELANVLTLLDRAKYGIEFFGISDFAKEQLIKIKNQKGIYSFNEFLILMTKLSKHKDYQILCNAKPQDYISNSMSRFRTVIEFVCENYGEQISMPEVANLVGMQSSQFSRRFKEASGHTFTDFVNHTRINKACELLSETDQYISSICYSVGYNTVANFNRRFVEIKKTTPSKYRKQCQLRLS